MDRVSRQAARRELLVQTTADESYHTGDYRVASRAKLQQKFMSTVHKKKKKFENS